MKLAAVHSVTEPGLIADQARIRTFLANNVETDIQLTAIHPDRGGSIRTKWFGTDKDAAATWATTLNGQGFGLFFTVNRAPHGVDKKPTDAEIRLGSGIRFAHVDIDGAKDSVPLDKAAAVAMLEALDKPPSFIVDSGNGVHGYWRYDDDCQNWTAALTVNQSIAAALPGGDHCFDLSRILRLPWTVNYPDANKRARGRVPTLATVLIDDTGQTYQLHELAGAFPRAVAAQPANKHTVAAGPVPLITADDLELDGAPLSEFDQIRLAINFPGSANRSTNALACAGEMVRAGFGDREIIGVLLNPANPVAAHCLDASQPLRAAARKVEKAREDDARDRAATAHGAAVAAGMGVSGNVAPPIYIALFDPADWQDVSPPLREWAVADWLPAKAVTYLGGAGSSGKSLLAQLLCTVTALGLPFFGLNTRQTTSVYITCEDDLDELHRRQAAICDGLGVSLSELSGRLYLASLAGKIGNELVHFDKVGRMALAPAWGALKEAAMVGAGAGLIVLDNVAHLFPGDESNRYQVSSFVNLLTKLATEAAAAVVLIGHPAKATGSEYSGSTGWENHVRMRLFLDYPRDADGTILDHDARSLRRGKSNYSSKDGTLVFRWHRWTFALESDLPRNVGAEAATSILAQSENAAFLACLDARTALARATAHSPQSTNFYGKAFPLMEEGRRFKRKAFEAAYERLLRARIIEERAELWRGPDRHFAYGIKRISGAGECGEVVAK